MRWGPRSQTYEGRRGRRRRGWRRAVCPARRVGDRCRQHVAPVLRPGGQPGRLSEPRPGLARGEAPPPRGGERSRLCVASPPSALGPTIALAHAQGSGARRRGPRGAGARVCHLLPPAPDPALGAGCPVCRAVPAQDTGAARPTVRPPHHPEPREEGWRGRCQWDQGGRAAELLPVGWTSLGEGPALLLASAHPCVTVFI